MDTLLELKIILLGPENSGKTCLLSRILTGEYIENQKSTQGARFETKTISFNNKSIRLNIWDTVGELRYQAFSKLYCKNTKAVILTYDLSNPSTIKAMRNWYLLMNQEIPQDSLIYVVGCKSDIATYSTEIQQEIEDFCHVTKSLHFLVSSKTGSNTESLLIKIIQDFIESCPKPRNSIYLSRDALKSRNKCC